MAADAVAWEHLIVYLKANAQRQASFLQQKWPGQQFPKYAAQALMPELDSFGQRGWELVSIQPVEVGNNGDIAIHRQSNNWIFTYLCVFKRPVRSEVE